MLRIIMADWRRYVWQHLIGWGVWVFVLSLVYRLLTRTECPSCPLTEPAQIRLLLLSLLFAQTPLVLWVQFQGTGCYLRQRLTDTLPLSLHRLNATRVLTGLMFLGVGLIPWTVTLTVWRSAGAMTPLWVPVFAGIATIGFHLISMWNLFPRVLIPVVTPLIALPRTEELLRWPLEWTTRPTLPLALGLATVLFGWWVLRQPPPRWTR